MRQVTSGMEPFGPQGHNLKNLGKSPLAKATCQYYGLGLLVSDKKKFKSFSMYVSM